MLERAQHERLRYGFFFALRCDMTFVIVRVGLVLWMMKALDKASRIWEWKWFLAASMITST